MLLLMPTFLFLGIFLPRSFLTLSPGRAEIASPPFLNTMTFIRTVIATAAIIATATATAATATAATTTTTAAAGTV